MAQGARLSSAQVVAEVRRLVRQPGLLKYDGHAIARMDERNMTRRQVRYILATGYHVTNRDQFNDRYNDWAYVIEGATTTGRRLRVAVAFIVDEPLPDRVLMVITVIGLD